MKKSTAKAAGLKSTFKVSSNEYLMTSFGKGNAAENEKRIFLKESNGEVHDLNDPAVFSASYPGDESVIIEGRAGTAGVSLPTAPQDHLRAKSDLEKEYFGKEFPNDNIHIQMIYKILDIRKLMAVYTNVAGVALDNLSRQISRNGRYTDFIGNFFTYNTFEAAETAYEISLFDVNKENRLISQTRYGYRINKELWNSERRGKLRNLSSFVDEYIRKNGKLRNQGGYGDYALTAAHYIRNVCGLDDFKKIHKAAISMSFVHSLEKTGYYFGSAFFDSEGNFDLKKAYEMIRIVAFIRNASFHASATSDWIYNADKDEKSKGLISFASKVFDERLEGLNNKFVSQNMANFGLLKALYPNDDINESVKLFYSFSVTKSQKNIGFSIKKLREFIIAGYMNDLNDKKYDSVRQKINGFVDFVLFRYFNNHEDIALSIVEELRESLTDEDKESVYSSLSEKLYKAIGRELEAAAKCASGFSDPKEIKKYRESVPGSVKNLKFTNEGISSFTKIIYCFSLFLDAKEINMFFSSLINAFENIASFLDVTGKLDGTFDFDRGSLKEKYDFFESSSKIAEELRLAKSIASMNKTPKAVRGNEVTTKFVQFEDAFDLLSGQTFKTEEDKKNYISEIFSLDKKSGKKPDHSVRNFIINNVINSNRFLYVVRFMNPSDARKIMKNKALVRFALSDIPDSQVLRYCKTINIGCREEPDMDELKDSLSEKLVNVSIDTFKNVPQKNSRDREETLEKERLKALISLYLTVLYLIVKTMVRINMSYCVAFGVFERDINIVKGCLSTRTLDEKMMYGSACDITDSFIAAGYMKNARVRKSVENNRKYFSPSAFKFMRNNIVHFSVVSNLANYASDFERIKSYFDIYHYISYMLLYKAHCNREFLTADAAGVYEKMKKYGTCSKDFLYGIMIPFAYNPARYINLSNREKFIEGFGK